MTNIVKDLDKSSQTKEIEVSFKEVSEEDSAEMDDISEMGIQCAGINI